MSESTSTKLWGGRFREGEDALLDEFNSSFPICRNLYAEDIEGSIAHVKMQTAVGLLTKEEGETLISALEGIRADIESGKLPLEGDYEDIHTFVELQLTSRVGEIGKKVHTARSRNDQVAIDMRLYARKHIKEIIGYVEHFQETLKTVADNNPCLMPGYTHLQRAQVITFKHHLMAYYEMMARDKERLSNALRVMDMNVLGCGALAGTTHSIDRSITTRELGFDHPCHNFLDGVSDRDFLLESMADFSILCMHLSRLAEEMILWCSKEFDFVELDDLYTTGSSIMPQKKNADGAELIRGKAGRMYGNLMTLLTVMKGLPLAYNKDMQEDKECYLDSVHTVGLCLQIMDRMVATMKVKKENMRKACKAGFLNATEVADYLVQHGVPFRTAHGIVGQIVIYCEDHKKAIEDLTIDELRQFSDRIGEDIYPYIDYDNILHKGIKKEML